MNSQAIAPPVQLESNRRWFRAFLLSIITFGIYGIIFYTRIARDINTIAGPHDGKKTMHYCKLLFLLTLPTALIATFVWTHRLSARIGRELKRRELPYDFGAKTFWGWKIFGSLLLLTGPFVYLHKLCRAMNLLSVNFNING